MTNTSYVSKTHSYRPRLTPAPNRLRDKVALITGAGRGIGRAIALRYAEEGAHIAVVDKDLDPAADTVRLAAQFGVKAKVFRADIADREAVENTVAQVREHFKRVDILVNNAGMIVFGSLIETRLEDWNRMMAVDLTGAFHFTQLVGRLMVEQGQGGRMIHVGSTASLLPASQQGAYCVAKAGLMMMSRVAALELADFGITSNLLCPQGAITDINRDLLSTPAVLKALEESIPAHRMATVEEIAAAAAYLASDEASYITGTELVHDGGATISALWWR